MNNIYFMFVKMN